MKRFAAFQLPWIAYAGLIVAVSSIPRLPDPKLDIEHLDKLAHLVEYFIFVWLACRALANLGSPRRRLPVYPVAIALSIAFAALDEYHQSFVRGRESDIYDLLADTVGILLGVCLRFWWYRRGMPATE